MRAALTVAQALRKTGDPAAAAPYLAYARTNLEQMRADAFTPAALAIAEAELALADCDRAAALRHLQLSAAQPSFFNICHGPEWIGASPAWGGTCAASPASPLSSANARALVNRQRAEIGLKPASLP